jgi:alpha-tubulin suppressor-like RCC1 family protein
LNSLILTDTNKVYSFGDNNYGQLGLGDTSNRTIPTLIENFDVFIGIKLLLLLYKNNNFYYENSDTSNIELIGSNISKEDFDNYGSGNFLNIQDIIKNGYSILYFDEK